MADLEPITREEMLLDGQDLEPITRKEMFIKRIYDKTQVIPEPITREEIFLKKAGDETTDVIIEQLTATENRTYSEEGVAYSPVIVNVPQTTLTTLDVTENGTYTAPSGTAYNEVEVDVPLPENAYLLKDIPATPASIATFTDGSDLPMPKLEVGIEPIQEGSGDPSPTNIRPISGWSAVDVTVADDVDNPTTTETITIQLGSTYYGGKLDVVSGVLTVNKLFTKGTTVAQVGQSGSGVKYADTTNMYTGLVQNALTISDRYIQIDTSQVGEDGKFRAYNGVFTIYDNRFTDITTAQSYLNDVEFCYELATPTTIQLTPTQVNSLEGVNNIFANSGKIINGQYFSKGE